MNKFYSSDLIFQNHSQNKASSKNHSNLNQTFAKRKMFVQQSHDAMTNGDNDAMTIMTKVVFRLVLPRFLKQFF